MKHLLLSITIALSQCVVLLGQIPVVDATSILTQTMTDYDIVMTADLSLESSERLNAVLRGLSERFFGNGTEDKAVLASDLLSLTSEMATYSSRILQAESIVKDYSRKLGSIRTGSDAASTISGVVFTVQDYYNYSDRLYMAVKELVSSRYRTISQKQDAIEKARRELSERGLFVLDSVSTRIEHLEAARSLAD
ncbi:MAG: hypothetical protein MJZ16_11900 [Bacteroidales bacterium]|nr:hypothetical protein [Bacteroidales bacterium]